MALARRRLPNRVVLAVSSFTMLTVTSLLLTGVPVRAEAAAARALWKGATREATSEEPRLGPVIPLMLIST